MAKTDTCIYVPYGEFKGQLKPLHLFPSGMLKWIAENHRNDRIATLADQEYQFREKYNVHADTWGD